MQFDCAAGELIDAMIDESLASGQRINRPIQVVATCPSRNGDEAMARFVLTLSSRPAEARGRFGALVRRDQRIRTDHGLHAFMLLKMDHPLGHCAGWQRWRGRASDQGSSGLLLVLHHGLHASCR